MKGTCELDFAITPSMQRSLLLHVLNMQDYISCDACYLDFHHDPQYAKGDPRNLVLIGHWDGFQPFRSTGKHSCGKKQTHLYIQA